MEKYFDKELNEIWEKKTNANDSYEKRLTEFHKIVQDTVSKTPKVNKKKKKI